MSTTSTDKKDDLRTGDKAQLAAQILATHSESTTTPKEDYDKQAAALVNAIGDDESSDDEHLSALEKEAAEREMAAITSSSASTPKTEETGVVEQVGLVAPHTGTAKGGTIDEPAGDTSQGSEGKDQTSKPADKKPFWDFALENLLVGLGTLHIDNEDVYCSSCQKELELPNLRIHLEGDGHKLNTLWNYDKSLAEVTAELRNYPKKFEMEMFKHIVLLNKMERRYDITRKVESKLRELFEPDPRASSTAKDPTIPLDTRKKREQPEMKTEEIAEMKAEFIASFLDPLESSLVHQAVMGEIQSGAFTNPNSAATALKVISRLGKQIAGYQVQNFEDGYEVDLKCILGVKDQCSKLLKIIDEATIAAKSAPNPNPMAPHYTSSSISYSS